MPHSHQQHWIQYKDRSEYCAYQYCHPIFKPLPQEEKKHCSRSVYTEEPNSDLPILRRGPPPSVYPTDRARELSTPPAAEGHGVTKNARKFPAHL